MTEIKVYTDSAALARAAAEHFVNLAAESIAKHGRFSVALAGGSTPRATYALLASKEFASNVDWRHIRIFWGDERCVPPNHPDSNYRMAREALLDHVPIPTSNVYRIPCEQEPEQAAAAYERTLRDFFTPPIVAGDSGRTSAGRQHFDLILLGMGDDGHTASLFPGTAALRETTRWVAANYVDKLNAWRVTLTPVAINAAACVTLLVSGAGKAERLHLVLEGPYQPDILPTQLVRPTDDRLVWLVDAAAAARLSAEFIYDHRSGIQ